MALKSAFDPKRTWHWISIQRRMMRGQALRLYQSFLKNGDRLNAAARICCGTRLRGSVCVVAAGRRRATADAARRHA